MILFYLINECYFILSMSVLFHENSIRKRPVMKKYDEHMSNQYININQLQNSLYIRHIFLQQIILKAG